MRVSAARTVSALALLIALSACDADDGPSLAEPTPVTSTPALTPTPPRPPSPFADLPLGRAPSVGYVDHYVHIAPDGTRTRLPRGRGISSITPFLDSFLVADTRYFEATNGLALVRDGERQDLEPCASGGGVTSVAGGTLAWATFGCPESSILSGPTQIHRQTQNGHEVQAIDIEPNTHARTSVAGFLDGDIVFNRAFLDGAFTTDLVSAPQAISGLGWVSSIDEVGGRFAGQAGREGRIGVVVDPTTGSRLWGVFGTQPTTFSPRGTSIVASSRSWSVLDASTGTVRYELDVPDRVYLYGFAWEDEHHLLAVAWSRRETMILRFDARGNAELAAPAVRLNGSQPAYVLDSQP